MKDSISIIFLVSSGGGTLRFINTCISSGILKDNIAGVIGDRECNAINYAKKNGLNNYVINYSKESNHEMKSLLKKFNPDFIITNIHKLIDPELVNIYQGKLINLHYSLLPAFAGFNAVKKALGKGCKFIGTTVHYVDEQMDNGEIISQNVIPLRDKNMPFPLLMDMIFQAGCLNLLNSLLLIRNENLTVYSDKYKDIIFSPPIFFNPLIFNEIFWEGIKNKK